MIGSRQTTPAKTACLHPKIPATQLNGILLIGKETVDEEKLKIHKYVYLLKELAKDSNKPQVLNGDLSFNELKAYDLEDNNVAAEEEKQEPADTHFKEQKP